MADKLEIKFSDNVSPALKGLPKNVSIAIKRVVKETADRVFKRIIDSTPRDRGTAARGWRRRRGKEGAQEFVNNIPYINVLEYGGYPVVPASRAKVKTGLKRGNAFLGGHPPKARTQKAPSGSPSMRTNVSRQAPRGMVRQNLERIQARYAFDLEEAIDRALAGLS